MCINHPAREKSTQEIELSTLAIYEEGKLGRDKKKGCRKNFLPREKKAGALAFFVVCT